MAAPLPLNFHCMKAKVLIVEDDIDLGNVLKQYLELNDFVAHRAFNGLEAREELRKNSYDILVIDVMMPKEDGFTLGRKIGLSNPGLPFLFLTARKLKEDVLHGLKIGADDYILKPFDADELILRIHNILKRTVQQIPSHNQSVQVGLYRFDPVNLHLSSANTEKMLTEKEAQLLLYLYQHRNRLIKRDEILSHLWREPDFFSGRSMDVFITRLRKLLAEDSNLQIESIRGVGFKFLC
jgi:DNA-binding response OmpR family regulator